MQEEWVDIKTDRDTYELSNYGRFRKKARIGPRGYYVKGRDIKPNDNSSGYLRVSMRINGKVKYYFVHRLVATYFIPASPGRDFVNHKDGNKHNNHVSNLEWCTRSENQTHAVNHGLTRPNPARGEMHWSAKLTWDDVREIRSKYKKGDKELGQCALAKKYNTTQSNIYDIVNNRSWVEYDHTDTLIAGSIKNGTNAS